MTAESKADWSQVEHFLHAGQAATIPLGGSALPRVDYVVTDDRDIALHLELTSRQRLPRSPHPLIRVEEIAYEGMRMARLRTTQRQLLRDFHDLLCAVADRVVDRGRAPDQAFSETVQAWRALLDRPRATSLEKRIGLMGELVMLTAIAASHGWQTAAESWRGSYGEEHDFGLPSYDIEVKTTSAEERSHTIHGLSQLTPSADRPLWLVSLQLTRGGAHGRTFTQCVSSVREQLADHTTGAAVETLDERLAAVSQPDAANSLPADDERWSLRSEPLVLMVDEHVPRLDHSLLRGLPPEAAARISHVDYNINVTGLPAAPAPPAALRSQFCLP
ncbi:PD-(D/E)XK motif protein [Streptomyces hygroscopicus]|uniref:PD-(D/E)XK motif protein n=1 Tax=Streptomyces hygroscopicus TaxID=1912 RepID=UPI0033F15FC2